jgi:hypothetical protein
VGSVNRTFPTIPLELQTTFWMLPMAHVSPPFGDMSVMLPPPIVAFTLLTSAIVESVRLVMRTRAWVVAGPGTVQGWTPSFGVLLRIVDHDVPPFREIPILTFPAMPLGAQAMF